MRKLHSILPVLLISATLGLAQNRQAEADRDEADVIAHRLNINTLKKVLQANRNLLQLLKADPALGQRMRRKAEESDSEGGKSLNGKVLITRMERMIESEPKVVSVYRSAGLTVREGLIAPAAFAIYGLASYSAQNGKIPGIKGLLPENLTFLREHKAEVQKIGQEMQEIGKEMNALTASEEESTEDEEKSGPTKKK